MARTDRAKIQRLIDALTELKNKVDKTADPKKSRVGMDKYEAKKADMADFLEEATALVNRIVKLNDSGKGAPQDLIVAKNKIRNQFAKADKLSEEFKAIILKDAKSSDVEKKKRSEAGGEYLNVFWREMSILSKKAREVKLELKTQGDDEEENRSAKTRKDRQEKRRKEREERKQRWKGTGGDGEEKGGKKGESDDDLLAQIELGHVGGAGSEQEQLFMQQAAEAMQQENEMLEQISAALTSLTQLAMELQKNLKISEALINEVDEKMDKVQDRLDAANARLTEMLEESGGMTRWCPFMILAMVLLALVGYMWGFL